METEPRQRINTWKEIATFLDRDGRTVQRWEKSRNLPVHRIPGERGGVFAYSDELTDWLNRGGPGGDDSPDATADSSDPSFNSAQSSEGYSRTGLWHPAERRLWLTRILWALVCAACILLAFFAVRHKRLAAIPSAAPLEAELSTNPQAKEAYLRGRFLWNQREGPALLQALDLFKQAEQSDPHFAAAFVGEAETYELLPEFEGMSPADAFSSAEKAASQAVTLDPNSAPAHRAYAFALFYGDWRAKAAFAEFDRAVALDPNSSQTHHWYANALMAVNSMDAASKEMQRARELDPASTIMLIDQVFLDFNRGAPPAQEIAKLQELARAAPKLLLSRRYIAFILLQTGKMNEWAAQMAEIARMDKSPADERIVELMRGLPAGHTGDPLAHQRLCTAHSDPLVQRAVGLPSLASECMSTGDIQDSVALWKKSFEQRDPQWLSFATRQLPSELAGDASIRQMRDMVQRQIDLPL